MTISSIHRWFCFALEPQTMAVNMHIYIIICTCFFFVLAQAVVTSIFIRFMCCFVQVTSSGLCPHDNVGSWGSIHVLLYVSILLYGHIPPDTLICHKTKQKPWKYGYVEVPSQYTCTAGVLSQYTCTLFMLLRCSRPIHMFLLCFCLVHAHGTWFQVCSRTWPVAVHVTHIYILYMSLYCSSPVHCTW